MRFADLKNDFVFRRIFANHPDILRGLLNDLLERQGERAIEVIEYLPSERRDCGLRRGGRRARGMSAATGAGRSRALQQYIRLSQRASGRAGERASGHPAPDRL
ncbi:hypothetical protein BE17_28760 [Sorangium cellulosum]|uniref:Uncharacterized protein n=1 Tax=Sorangium cellulosum TaxID=56 RepID=A0A150RLG4_SORCE|nr:hypothetical protein BE17_28760 [Sorangium cellulosum]